MTDCIFCQIIQNRTAAFLYENDDLVVIKDIYPKAPIHLLVITKTHLQSLNALDKSHHDLIANLMLSLPQIAKDNGLEEGYRTVTNTGPGGGQVVPHIHFHLMGGGKLTEL